MGKSYRSRRRKLKEHDAGRDRHHKDIARLHKERRLEGDRTRHSPKHRPAAGER